MRATSCAALLAVGALLPVSLGARVQNAQATANCSAPTGIVSATQSEPAIDGLSAQAGVSSATVNATVDPHGLATRYMVLFRKGDRGPYDQQTPWQALPDCAVRQVSVPLSGLQAGSYYGVRVAATNAYGTVESDTSVTTEPGPLPPVDVVALTHARRTVAGQEVTISARVAGNFSAYGQASLRAAPGGRAFRSGPTAEISSAGVVRFRVAPLQNTRYSVAVGNYRSRAVEITVMPAVQLLLFEASNILASNCHPCAQTASGSPFQLILAIFAAVPQTGSLPKVFFYLRTSSNQPYRLIAVRHLVRTRHSVVFAELHPRYLAFDQFLACIPRRVSSNVGVPFRYAACGKQKIATGRGAPIGSVVTLPAR